MKIRTDFVTNSSSSSFCVEIAFNLKNGSTVSFNAEGATGETGPINYFNGEAIVKASPKYLGTSKDINELIQRLTDGVFDLAWDNDIDDEVEIKIFEKSYPVESEWGETYDAYEFIEEIRDNINLLKDIKSIVISGTEEGVQGQKYKQVYKYDLDTDEYTGLVYGGEFESEGTAGKIQINDLNLCKLEYKECDQEENSQALFVEEDDEDSNVGENVNEIVFESESHILDNKWEVYGWKNTKTGFFENIWIRKYIGNDENVIIPENTFGIDQNAFENCESIMSVAIPESVHLISYGAFKNCKKLENLILPSNISYIDKETFYGCENCKTLTFLTSDPITIACSAVYYSGIQKIEIPNSEIIILEKLFNDKIKFYLKSGIYSAEEVYNRVSEFAQKIKKDANHFNEYPLGKVGATEIEELLSIDYENRKIKEIMDKYNYKCDVCDAFSIRCCIDLDFITLKNISENIVAPFPYYGVKKLENLTKTIISFLINNGTFDDGFLEDIMENFDSIIKSYTTINGDVVSCTDRHEDICKGYIFEMKKGRYICKAEECWGGW